MKKLCHQSKLAVMNGWRQFLVAEKLPCVVAEIFFVTPGGVFWRCFIALSSVRVNVVFMGEICVGVLRSAPLTSMVITLFFILCSSKNCPINRIRL